MTPQEKIKYMKVATGIVGYNFNPQTLDLLVSLYELVIEKQGETSLKEVCKVEAEVIERHEPKDKQHDTTTD